MEVLLELDRLIDPEQINVIGQKADLAELLYAAMKNGLVTDEKEGAQRFYPGRSRAGDQMARLKKRLLQRMTNSVLSHDELHSGYWEKYYQAYKGLLLSDIFTNKGRTGTAAKIAIDVFKLADKYHFTTLAVESCRILTYHYAVTQANPKRYREYKARLQEKVRILDWENKAYEYYQEIGLELRVAKTVGEALIKSTEGYKAELDRVADEIRSFNFQRMRINIDLMFFRMVNDVGKIVQACTGALVFFSGLHFSLPTQAQRSIYFNLVPAYLQSGAYTQAQDSIAQVKTLLHPGSANWISIHQYEAILGFYTQDLSLVRRTLATIQKGDLPVQVAEELLMYQLYLDLLGGEENFKLGRFLNEVPTYTADKKGMNINILILQMLIFLRRNERPAIIDRMEALQAYAYRYLTKDPATRRSELFFRMLFLLAKSAFELREVERRSPGITAELSATPRHISAIDIEVVPYEMLWGKVGEWCGSK